MDSERVNDILNDLQYIKLQDLLSSLETIDIGDVQYQYVEGYKRQIPKFGTRGRSEMVRHTFHLENIKSLKDFVVDRFVDNELKKVKNTPLSFGDAVEEFSSALLECGRKPTHVVELGRNLYAVISAEDMHVRVGMHHGKLVAALMNTFDQFPVFRVKG
jgi:hypothetical protein